MIVQVFDKKIKLEMNAYGVILHRKTFAKDFWADRKLFAQMVADVETAATSARIQKITATLRIFYTLSKLGGEERNYEEFLASFNYDVYEFIKAISPHIQKILIEDMATMQIAKYKKSTVDTDVEPTCEMLINRSLELGLKTDDLKEMSTGQITDLLISKRNEESSFKKPKIREATLEEVLAF